MAIVGLELAHLAGFVIAAGGVGTAAMGIVDTLKARDSLGVAGIEIDGIWKAGLNQMLATLAPLQPALRSTFGEAWREVVEIHYRGDHSPAAMKQVISRAVRLGLPELQTDQLDTIAERYGHLDRENVRRAMAQLRGGETLDTISHGTLERLMAAVDAHVEGAALRASKQYRYAARATASAVAIGLGAVIGLLTATSTEEGSWADVPGALLLGVVAVPVAPIAKDLATAVKNFSVRS